MGRIGLSELLVILAIVLLFFGVKRLPEIGNALGKAIREFKKASKKVDDEVKDITQEEKE